VTKMLIELKTFQVDAVAQLVDELDWAKSEFQDRGKLQAVVLSAPTGSGKTVVATRLIESIFFGSEQCEPDPAATFLWLSDRPQLNKQSRNKMLSSSELLTSDRLVEVGSDFDREMFEGGKVYFLNTQKLGQEKILTSAGDNRNFTIWETIQNTARNNPTKFHLVLDEAHRGLGSGKSTTVDGLQPTIVQKFLKGSEGELSPIPIVIGISATPARFQLLMETDSTRQVRNITVDPFKVRDSGLLKDRVVVFHPDRVAPSIAGSEFALLAEAAREWLSISEAWHKYSQSEDIVLVEPALIVQVEDGGSGLTSKTDLSKVVRTIEDVVGQLPDGAVRHCFDSEAPININGRLVEKVDASEIQSLTYIKVVLFKTSLTTGWDCPRAEVMMSFRKVQDATLIAQLIGRMVRTPLARRIADVDQLNSVALFLPHYDQVGLQAVINHLKRDAESASASDIVLAERVRTLNQSLWNESAFNALSQVPTYRLDRGPKIPPVKRLLRLAFYLTQQGIDELAFESVQGSLLAFLHEARAALSAADLDFETRVSLADKLPLVGWEFSRGEWKILDRSSRVIPLTDESLDLIFKKASIRVCGSGEGLPMKYFKDRVLSGDFNNDHMRPKIEFVLIAEDAGSVERLERFADDKFDRLYNQYRAEIRSLPDEARQDIENLRTRGQVPEPIDLKPWRSIIVPVPDETYDVPRQSNHLYVDDANGWAPIVLSQWEQSVVNHVQTSPDFVGWLRNFPRKEWALSIPYIDAGSYKPHFPDLLVVREKANSMLVDILEPHGLIHLGDSWAKAKGMAEYAGRHSYQAHTSVGAVEMQTIDEQRNSLRSLDFSRVDVQTEMRQITSREAFLNLFDRLSEVETLRSIQIFAEHACVNLNRSITVDGETFQKGTLGVVVSVYEDYLAYAVEVPSKVNGSAVITVTHQQLKLASLH
jgi:type III restriction enzyme